tara:strand:+ start:362 stop:580 length:219 start_codon:yes stop_codon:yes gene_type:complete
MEFLPELIGVGLLTLVGWFANRVTSKMDDIHKDIKGLAINHGERITRLETSADWRRRKYEHATMSEQAAHNN